ncbi:MAG TPA: HipA family kinase [Solirubrobacteraceae bacterium]|nr:HipA family kinase [Solirubrobacteraceae bacterium]
MAGDRNQPSSPTVDALRSVCATRYVAPLREGGSLPGLVEADDDGMYVMKFRGAGQGVGALVAEVVAGELARSLDLLVPELVVAWLEPELARAEPDVEIQELAAASVGANLGVDFLPGALPFTPAAASAIDAELAAEIVWFDALVMNVDRTPRNPNLLAWHGRVWLIDHGAAFYRQHGEAPLAESAGAPFPLIRDHVLLDRAGSIVEADERLVSTAEQAISRSVALVPEAWLGDDPAGRRADFEAFLRERLSAPRSFVEEAEDARAA